MQLTQLQWYENVQCAYLLHSTHTTGKISIRFIREESNKLKPWFEISLCYLFLRYFKRKKTKRIGGNMIFDCKWSNYKSELIFAHLWDGAARLDSWPIVLNPHYKIAFCLFMPFISLQFLLAHKHEKRRWIKCIIKIGKEV